MIYGLSFKKIDPLLNLLFDAVSSTILSWFYEQNHKESFTPGFISTLHTFGRDLKWNPHIHVLITEGASGNFTPWKKFEVFPYIMLRNRFQTTLLFLLEKHFYDFIKRLIIHIYDKYFNVVRYYGLYAKKHKFSDKFNYMLKPHVAEFRKQLKNWRCRIELYFKHDPLKCSCGHTFHFDYLVQRSYNTS